MNKIIKHEFCTENENFKDSTFCILLGKDLKKCHYYSKRHYQNKKEKLPNVFDSLFSIRKVGFIIELIQNDISEILNPYLKDEDFEAYSEWCNEKNIVRRKAFQIRAAPY